MKKKKALTSIKGKKSQQINQREAKLINERAIEGFLLFDVEIKNSGCILHYNFEGLITLTDFLKVNPMNKRLFVILLRNVVLALKGIIDNHFSKNLIEWSLDASYVDPATWHVYLMYVPLQPYETEGGLKDFILEFVSGCTFGPGENADYVQALVREVNSGVSYTASMLESFCDRISEDLVSVKTNTSKRTSCPSCKMNLKEDESICPFCGEMVKKSPPMRQEVSPRAADEKAPVYSTLCEGEETERNSQSRKRQSAISVNEDENGVITVFRKSPNSAQKVWLEDRNHFGKLQITKFPFRIGKMEGVTDYRVYSHTVSRKHADILKEQGKYYLVDLGSTNGTYLNGKRIQPGVKEELFDGSYLKLADTEFKFHID